MWEPFTEHARHAVVQAQEEAQGMGHGHIGTEHLLLALLAHTPVESALESLDVDLDPVRRELRRVSLQRAPGVPGQEMLFTANAKRVIDFAFAEARRLQHDFIGCEHLLVGVLRVPDSTACRAMSASGLDPEGLRAALQERASEAPRPVETLHLQQQSAARSHPQAVGQEALETLRLLREEVAAMRAEIAGLREFLAATPPPPGEPSS